MGSRVSFYQNPDSYQPLDLGLGFFFYLDIKVGDSPPPTLFCKQSGEAPVVRIVCREKRLKRRLRLAVRLDRARASSWPSFLLLRVFPFVSLSVPSVTLQS